MTEKVYYTLTYLFFVCLFFLNNHFYLVLGLVLSAIQRWGSINIW